MQYDKSVLRAHVNSDPVRSMGYDEDEWVLQVELSDGSVHNYLRVPPKEYQALKNAESIGKHLKREISRYYESEEVESAEESFS